MHKRSLKSFDKIGLWLHTTNSNTVVVLYSNVQLGKLKRELENVTEFHKICYFGV